MTDASADIGLLVGDRFRLEALIGRGSMGEVYAASDYKLDGRAAVKLLRHEFLRDEEWKARFRREAGIAQTIDSPHIARMLDAGVSKGAKRPWIAFELVEGEPLDARLRHEPMPAFSDAAWMIADLLRGLEAVHAASIIHRDIKPGNLFVERTPQRLRLLDFGIAKKVHEAAGQTSALTRMDDQLGTPAFMSPEQLRDPATVDARTDLYSVGCVAFRLLTGHLPFEADEPFGRELSGIPSLSRASSFTWPEAL
jgi:serine/threonine protein kinase